MKGTLLSVQNISVDLAGRAVLRNVGFDVSEGEFFSLLGPSGCGKTTLLKIIAGFLGPTSGDLLWNSKPVTRLAPQHRDLNLVFQNYALFPHMNVFENVAFGLRMQKLPEADVRRRTEESLELVRMSAFAQRRITELSGGQQQRIALARAVAPRPKLVLLDEPLGALDLQLRRQMQIELKTLQRKLGMTFIYVTHDQEEAFAMSDRIAILNQGHLEQVDSPEMLYRQPASQFVAQFIGTANFLSASALSTTHAHAPALGTEVKIFRKEPKENERAQANKPIEGVILVRPEQFALTPATNNQIQPHAGEIVMRQYLGSQIRYHIKLDAHQGADITVDQNSVDHAPLENGTKVFLGIRPAELPFYAGSDIR